MESDSVFEGAENPDNSAPTTSSKDVRSLFSKKKVRPAVIRNLPPPPPPPAPKVHSDSVGSHDEGWEREFQKLDAFLNEKGLHIVKVDSDGSCLFSSFALHFPDSSGDSIRQEAVTYMLENSDAFSPFIDTEAYLNGFDDYCARMRRPATWGGQLEIQAISQARGVNVYVFQTGGKSTVKMINFDEPETQCITLSYHDGEHYNSVLPTQSTELVTVSWLENRLSTENQPLYVDSNPVSKVPKTRKKVGLFN
jgi:hypothetical protein